MTPMVHRCRAPVLSLLVVALLAGASLGPVAAQPHVDWPIAPAIARAALASLFFAGALYLGDLYDLHAAIRDRTDGRRLLRALGVAAVAMAVADAVLELLVLPGWMLQGSLVLSAAGGTVGVVLARALPTQFFPRGGSLISDSWYAEFRYCGVYQ